MSPPRPAGRPTTGQLSPQVDCASFCSACSCTWVHGEGAGCVAVAVPHERRRRYTQTYLMHRANLHNPCRTHREKNSYTHTHTYPPMHTHMRIVSLPQTRIDDDPNPRHRRQTPLRWLSSLGPSAHPSDCAVCNFRCFIFMQTSSDYFSFKNFFNVLSEICISVWIFTTAAVTSRPWLREKHVLLRLDIPLSSLSVTIRTRRNNRPTDFFLAHFGCIGRIADCRCFFSVGAIAHRAFVR